MAGLEPAAVVLALVAAAAPGLAHAGSGTIDQERRVLRCTGLAAPMLREEPENAMVTRVRTERAARQDALRSCLDALKPLPARAGETLGGQLERDRDLRASVEALLKRSIGAAEQRFYSDGGVYVEAIIPLDGELARLLPAVFEPRGS